MESDDNKDDRVWYIAEGVFIGNLITGFIVAVVYFVVWILNHTN